VISTDMTRTGAGSETPPAVGLRSSGWADQVVLTAPHAAACAGTGLPVAGMPTAVRLRGLIAAAGTTGSTTTGAYLGAIDRPSAQTTAQREFVVAGVPTEHTSSTPGDLPPEDHLS
jgi:hypothetical protein